MRSKAYRAVEAYKEARNKCSRDTHHALAITWTVPSDLAEVDGSTCLSIRALMTLLFLCSEPHLHSSLLNILSTLSLSTRPPFLCLPYFFPLRIHRPAYSQKSCPTLAKLPSSHSPPASSSSSSSFFLVRRRRLSCVALSVIGCYLCVGRAVTAHLFVGYQSVCLLSSLGVTIDRNATQLLNPVKVAAVCTHQHLSPMQFSR